MEPEVMWLHVALMGKILVANSAADPVLTSFGSMAFSVIQEFPHAVEGIIM